MAAKLSNQTGSSSNGPPQRTAALGCKLLKSRPRIDLLVTDVGLPGGMSGSKLADAPRVRCPGLKMLFVTGYAEAGAVDSGLLDQGLEFMTKPLAVDTLASRLHGILSG